MDIKFNEKLKYKDVCEMLGDEEKKSTRQRTLQLKRWNKKYIVKKDKTWYTVERPLNEVEIKLKNVDNCSRPHKLFDKYNKNSDIIDYDFARNHGGVYKFQYNNIVYIGQTNNLYKRFTEHMTLNKETKAGKLLLKGGYYEILAVEEDLEQRLALERKYIKMYSNDNNFICINDDYNDSVKRKRKRKSIPRYKKVKFNYNEWEYIKEILDREGVTYYYDK